MARDACLTALRREREDVFATLSEAGISHGSTVEGLQQGLSVVTEMRAEVERLANAHVESQRNGAQEAVARKVAEAEVERLTNHIKNNGIDDLEARLSVADGKCARLEAEVERLREAFQRLIDLDGCDHGPNDCPDDCVMIAVENIAAAALAGKETP